MCANYKQLKHASLFPTCTKAAPKHIPRDPCLGKITAQPTRRWADTSARLRWETITSRRRTTTVSNRSPSSYKYACKHTPASLVQRYVAKWLAAGVCQVSLCHEMCVRCYWDDTTRQQPGKVDKQSDTGAACGCVRQWTGKERNSCVQRRELCDHDSLVLLCFLSSAWADLCRKLC